MWAWIKRHYQCRDCGGWNKSLWGRICFNRDCPSNK